MPMHRGSSVRGRTTLILSETKSWIKLMQIPQSNLFLQQHQLFTLSIFASNRDASNNWFLKLHMLPQHRPGRKRVDSNVHVCCLSLVAMAHCSYNRNLAYMFNYLRTLRRLLDECVAHTYWSWRIDHILLLHGNYINYICYIHKIEAKRQQHIIHCIMWCKMLCARRRVTQSRTS